MIDCMILGDSIAVGVSQAAPHCAKYAVSGYSTQKWNSVFLNKIGNATPSVAIISLGANDHQGIKTEQELLKLRSRLNAERVYWILPSPERKPLQVEIVRRVASDFGDEVFLRPKTDLSGDGIHFTGRGYKTIAQDIFELDRRKTNANTSRLRLG